MADEDEDLKELPAPNAVDEAIIRQAKERFKACEDWESNARILFEFDYKFANGDTHNKYQWDADLVANRELEDRPCLTINKTAVHNLLVINDAKQNKPGVRIRPVGEDASYEGAIIFQELVYHIEYISSAENVYDNATTFQVQAGIGYWRVNTDYISDDSFDQEIYIRRIKDPRSVYLDPDINEVDGSDARFGFIFEDMPKDLFKAKYPEYASIAGSSTLGSSSTDGWMTRDNVRIAEYYRKEQKKDLLIAFFDKASNSQVISKKSELSKEGKDLAKQLKKAKDPSYNERRIVTDDIQWFKIAGDRIIEKGPWLGKYVPIVRLVGTETVIDGVLDRKGHTRSLINAQQIYNYNTSANVEYGALQTKSPWVAPADAIEGYEEYYKTANNVNHSYLPYNHMGEDGQPIPPPTRPASPQSSPAYVQQMQIAQNEMMMATGQYQSQLGENENAKSGVAINARQRQGDRATYHFIDNQAIAIRLTGKILIDLIPKIYDTKRIKQIEATDGSIMNVAVDPNAEQAFLNVTPGKAGNPGQPQQINGQTVEEIIFNPNFGIYDIQADTGPSFATRRQEAFNAMTQIAANNKEFMNVGGDLLWKVADFPEADILAQRWRKIIPPNVLGDGPDPQTEQLMHQASDKIQQLTQMLAKQTEELASKEKELDIKAKELDLKFKEATAEHSRLDYDAETKRLVALGNSGPGISVDQIQPLVRQIVEGMLRAGDPSGDHVVGIKTAQELADEKIAMEGPDGQQEGTQPEADDDNKDSLSDVPGSRLAKDGFHYVKNPEGGYMRVETDEGQFHPSKIGAKQGKDGHWYVPHHGNEGKFLRVHHVGH